ncbi:iron-containing alcohol dehydrogenase [Treponema primitia]|uniref:iron-containing alcohol dehydrogenase family protein n=1 Tax=Treponema primitia TaxID=88058 RepID=UPI00397F1E62
MNINYFMPTRVVLGADCIFSNRAFLGGLGKKALIVSGKNSARANGSLADTVKALEANGQSSFLYDRVMSNPTVDCAYEAADAISREGCDFIIALGGGSPMDAAKVAALLALNRVEKPALFGAAFTTALPIAAVPTTAGTGSEVTPYAILTNDVARTKTSIGTPAIFPRYAFLDARYTLGLSPAITINTAIDALSHAVEGMLSVKASAITNALARESISVIAGCFGALGEGRAPDIGIRERLLYGSMTAGMVIAHTGTTAVHPMGYTLTYNHNIDHGRANGLIFAEFLKIIEKKEKDGSRRIPAILSALGMKSLDEFTAVLDRLLGKKERFETAVLEGYAAQAAKAKNIANCVIRLEEEDLLEIFKRSIG